MFITAAWVTAAVKHLVEMQQPEGIFLSSELCLFAIWSRALPVQVNLVIRNGSVPAEIQSAKSILRSATVAFAGSCWLVNYLFFQVIYEFQQKVCLQVNSPEKEEGWEWKISNKWIEAIAARSQINFIFSS